MRPTGGLGPVGLGESVGKVVVTCIWAIIGFSVTRSQELQGPQGSRVDGISPFEYPYNQSYELYGAR